MLIFCDSGFGIRLTGKPLRLHPLHVVCESRSFFLLGKAIPLALLLGELTRMHHDKAERLHTNSSIAVLDLDMADDALPMPASGCFSLRPPRFLYDQGQGGLLLPPRFEFLPHSARAWD
jgi:hypothetical protein